MRAGPDGAAVDALNADSKDGNTGVAAVGNRHTRGDLDIETDSAGNRPVDASWSKRKAGDEL